MMMSVLLCLIQAPLVSSAAAKLAPVHAEPLDFVQAIGEGWTYGASLESEDGVERLKVTVINPGRARTLSIEAGLMFHGPEWVQPPVVMEDLLVEVQRGEHQFVVMHPGCGHASLASAEHGMAFDGGAAHISEELGRVMDRMNAGDSGLHEGLQDMVWVYTNGHGLASVYVPESASAELDRILAEEMDGYEAPGYAVQYREPEAEDEGRFSGEATEIRCDIALDMTRPEHVRVVMVQPDGERIEMMWGVDMRVGRHQFTLTMAFEGYPPGVYRLRIEGERSDVAYFEREVILEGQG